MTDDELRALGWVSQLDCYGEPWSWKNKRWLIVRVGVNNGRPWRLLSRKSFVRMGTFKTAANACRAAKEYEPQ